MSETVFSRIAEGLREVLGIVRGEARPYREIVRPFRPVIDAMKEKNPALYQQICTDPASVGLAKWREKYPEDFRSEPCSICHGSRRVCENHRDESWPDECNCGAGMNCPLCANEERK